ncbi:MAG: anti-sigma factor [Candidatus Eremiobacteraeota bacterium]|nr:anti-sigma factor [Candidatus Eremiobacteraeota bacterium]
MTGHEEMLDTIGMYALGALPAQEAQKVRMHLRSCAECQSEYAFLRPAVNALALSAQSEPGTLLKARIMKAIRPTTHVSGRDRTPPIVWPAYLVAAACLALALLTTISNLGLRNDLAQVHKSATESEHRVASQSRTLASERLMLTDLMAKDAKRYPVVGGEVIRRGDRLYLAMRSMAPLPKGHVYQAWTLPRGGKSMAPSLTFSPDSSGIAVISLPERGSTLAAVAVSIEPEGGSPAPTTKPEFVQKLSFVTVPTSAQFG